MMRLFSIFLFFSIFLSNQLIANELRLIQPKAIIEGIQTNVKLDCDCSLKDSLSIRVNGDLISEYQLINKHQVAFDYQFNQSGEYVFQLNHTSVKEQIEPIPLYLSILPPLIAILLALILKEVVSSLLIGIFSGAVILASYTHSWEAYLFGFLDMIDLYLVEALSDEGHISVILFSLMIGGMVSIISKNGGMQGVVNHISKFAKDAQSGQFATWFLGVAIFFDDYANTLIVGNTMRPVTDRLKISREKLAYLVDSTAAPMAAIAFITTWIGAELGYIESGIKNIDGLSVGVYATFIQSLAYSFYPVFTLIFMLLLIWKKRDFGPMLKAEMKARTAEQIHAHKDEGALTDDYTSKEGLSPKAYNAIIPVAIVILGTIVGLLYTGGAWGEWSQEDSNLSFTRKLALISGNADSYKALLWSSAAGLIAAIKLSVFQRKLSLSESIEAALNGFKTMLPALVILILAWTLAITIENLHTADFLSELMSDKVSPYLVPTITFLLAAIVAFSTGSSWGTMAILYPLMLPSSWAICLSAGLSPELTLAIFHNVVACVLAGSVLGDHCSPISDTTILSSLASSCNHIQHVRTQLPYALTVGLISILFGTLPSAFGVPYWITLPIGISVLYLTVIFLGKPSELKD